MTGVSRRAHTWTRRAVSATANTTAGTMPAYRNRRPEPALRESDRRCTDELEYMPKTDLRNHRLTRLPFVRSLCQFSRLTGGAWHRLGYAVSGSLQLVSIRRRE
jgi:hypothetical protein